MVHNSSEMLRVVWLVHDIRTAVHSAWTGQLLSKYLAAMIIIDDKKTSPTQQLSAYGAASSSHQARSGEIEHPLVDISGSSTAVPLVPDEPPPSFTTYTAEFFLDSSDNVVSHDHHLNTTARPSTASFCRNRMYSRLSVLNSKVHTMRPG
jgi:hypothetical protein